MRAVGFHRFGGPEVLEVVELPEPPVRRSQVRVRVAGAAVNPTDLLFRAGRRPVDLSGVAPPYVPGMDLAGWVDAVGEGVDDLRSGDPVIGVTSPPPTGAGAQAELVVLPVESVVAAPAGRSLLEASTLGMNGLTARQALDLLALPPGATVGVTGAAGAVGGYTVQLAKAADLRVLAFGRERDRPQVEALGADGFVSRIEDLSELDGLVDAALVGTPALAAVKDGGGVATLRAVDLKAERGVAVHLVAVSRYLRERARLAELARLAHAGRLDLRVADVLPPERAAEAHRRLEAGGVRGRLVVKFEAAG